MRIDVHDNPQMVPHTNLVREKRYDLDKIQFATNSKSITKAKFENKMFTIVDYSMATGSIYDYDVESNDLVPL